MGAWQGRDTAHAAKGYTIILLRPMPVLAINHPDACLRFWMTGVHKRVGSEALLRALTCHTVTSKGAEADPLTTGD